jgi:hypothetical protein
MLDNLKSYCVFSPFPETHSQKWKHHVYVEFPDTGFGLMTRFIGLFDTAHDYKLEFTVTHTLVSTVTSSLLLLGSGFQQHVPLPLGS